MLSRKYVCIVVFWEAEVSMGPVGGTSIGSVFALMSFGLRLL